MARKKINKTVTKNPAGAPSSVVINAIDVRALNRTTQDVPKWRTAIQSAEANTPRRNLLYTLYFDVALDAHVLAVTGKRIDAVTTANWQFVNKDGEAVDVINDIIDSIGFDEVLTEIINSKFWGYSILEPKFFKGHNDTWEVAANLIPRLHYRPEKGIVAYNPAGDDGINIREGIYTKTIMEVGKLTDLGLFISAAQYAILKRGGMGDYAMFVQVFGRPIIDATWDGVDLAQRQKLKESLDIGAGGVIIRPEGTAIELKEGSGAQSTIHLDFIKMQNKEISKALLGSTETTESSDSSGYAQSKTHGEQDSKKFDSDLNFVRRVLNSRFVKILEAHGFNTEGGKFVIQGEETELSTTETFNIYKGLKDTFDLPFEDDTLYEVFGVQKPDNYDSLKKEQLEAAKTKDPLEISPGNSDPTKKDPKKKKDTPEEKEVKLAMATTEEETTAVEKIKNLVDKYIKNLKELFLTAPTETIGATNGNRHIVNLAFNSDFDNEALIQRIWDAEGKSNFDATLFQHTLNTLLSAFKQGWDTNSKKVDLAFNTSFEYGVDDPAMLTAFELNLFKFTGGKDLALVNKLNQLFRESKSFEEFYQKASKQAEIFNKHWLETEYNTAVLSGEAAANYTRLQKVAHIFPYWKYVTAGDEHVRRSHQPLEGLILPANDKRWLKIFPPNGWNCRCYIVPVMKHEFDESQLKKMRSKADKYIKSPAFAKEKTQGFGINRGETGEVFTQNQLYINKMAGLGNKQLNNLSAANWGLPQFNSAQNVATEPIDTYTGTTDKWLAKNNTLRDYNNRQLAIEKTDFIRLINGAKEDKRLLLNAVVATLNNADEVWLSGKELQEILYVKYYQGNTFLVSSILNNFSLALTDFKTVANAETYRRGLLMFAKSS